MGKKLTIAGASGWLVGISMLTVVLTGITPTDLFRPISSIASAQGAPTGTMTDADARAAAATAGQQPINQTIGKAADYRGQELPPVQVNGRTIRLSDMELVEFRRVVDATSVTLSSGDTQWFGSPTNAWVATWERSETPIAEWGGKLATVRVSVILEDGTGRLLSATVAKFDPARP